MNNRAISLIAQAVSDHRLKAVYGLFSGGHDSLLSSYIASFSPLFRGVIYLNTLTGSKETRAYIYDICKKYNWNLIEQKPTVITYEMLLVKYGYPSPATHSVTYGYLKDRGLNKALSTIIKSEHIRRYEVGLVTGVRRFESRKRMLTVKPVTVQKGKTAKNPSRIFIAPLYDFHQSERDELIENFGLPRNAFADLMGHSYECQCGSNLGKEERSLRAESNPLYEEVELLREKMVHAAYELQKFRYVNGLIDLEDCTLDEKRLTWGWHTGEIFDYELYKNDDTLCSSCMVRNVGDGKVDELDEWYN